MTEITIKVDLEKMKALANYLGGSGDEEFDLRDELWDILNQIL
jgi:hypothetical protein